MRLKDYAEKPGKRVWLSEKEVQLLLSKAPDDKPDAYAGLLMAARCGLRRHEITQVCPQHIQDNQTGQVIRIWEGKGDKYREVPAPNSLVSLVLGMNRDSDVPIVDRDDSTVYNWVRAAAEQAQAHTEDTGWEYVGPHDLRRSWGVRLLESGVLPSVVMEWGGWNEWETFRDHYLAEFSPEALREERKKVSWLGGGHAERESMPVGNMDAYR